MAKIAAVSAGMVLVLTGCSSGDDQPSANNSLGTITAGSLTVCSDPPFAPFEFEDASSPSGYSGFDIDVSDAIATKLGLKLVVVDTDFDALQSGASLDAGVCDMGASGITITEDRKSSIDFSAPYYDSLQSLLVAKASGITSLDDLAGKNIGVQTGSTGEHYANENKPDSATVVSFPSDGEMWVAIQAGQVDALLEDFPINHNHAKADPLYTVVGKYQTNEQYGLTFAKGKNPTLVAAVDAQLETMRSDGTYDKIYDKYFS
jgi:polar amino acid transport system substrate-binding protein